MRKPGGCGLKNKRPQKMTSLYTQWHFLPSWTAEEFERRWMKKEKCFALFIGCLSCQMMLYVDDDDDDVNTPLKCISYKDNSPTLMNKDFTSTDYNKDISFWTLSKEQVVTFVLV